MLNVEIVKRWPSSVAAIQRISVFFLLFVFVTVSPGYAQQFGLPSIDGVTMFYRAGRLSGGPWQAKPTPPCAGGFSGTPLCGWGFETTYDLLKEQTKSEKQPGATNDVQQPVGTSGVAQPAATGGVPQPKKKSKWGAELAVGYDFLNLLATSRSNNYEIRGSLQTLPSITLYISRDLTDAVSVYGGIGTGLVVLKNLRAYDASGRVYALSGDTWGLTPSIGLLHHLRESDKVSGVNVFVEFSYEVRDFPSVSYLLPPDVKTLPSDLPRSLAAAGPVLNFGIEFALKKKPEKPSCCK